MLGKTHMAIGACGALVAAPLLAHLHNPFLTVPHAIVHVAFAGGGAKLTGAKSIVRDVEYVAAALLGSVVPDFDEQHSLMARKAERVVQVGVIAVLLWLIFQFRLASSVEAWGFTGVIALLLISKANLMRRFALALIAVGMLYFGASGYIPTTSSFLLTAWCVGAMFTTHRTFTHSVWGFSIFSYAMYLVSHQYHLPELGTAVAIGYLLHILADVPAGSVPILWPIPPKVGGHLVKTGGAVDHLIGVIAVLGAVVSVCL